MGKFPPASSAPDFAGASFRRIVVRGVNWLGDAVMTTPALLCLRAAHPNAQITLLTPGKLEGLWPRHPALDSVLAISQRESPWSVGHRIRAGGFEAGLVLPNSHRAALEMWFGGVPLRIGASVPWRDWLLTYPVPAAAGTGSMRKANAAEIQVRLAQATPPKPLPTAAHQIFHYLRLVAELGASTEAPEPLIAVSNEEVDAARLCFGLRADVTWLGLNPGAEYGPAKRWPADRFIAAAIEVQQRTGCRWLILGGRAEVPLATTIAAVIQDNLPAPQAETAPVNLAGKTALRELCAVLKVCRAVLTNDTGPMHVAAAVGTPVVAPFGSTDPGLTAPGLPGDPRHRLLRSRAACSPCFLRHCPIDSRCLLEISVEQVVTAVLEAAGLRPGSAQPLDRPG